MWLKTKYYKTGENKKLSPRRISPWTIFDKLPNGLNIRIENDSTRNRKIVRHNRLTPSRSHAAQDLHDDGNEKATTTPTKTRNKPDREHPARENGPSQIVADSAMQRIQSAARMNQNMKTMYRKTIVDIRFVNPVKESSREAFVGTLFVNNA